MSELNLRNSIAWARELERQAQARRLSRPVHSSNGNRSPGSVHATDTVVIRTAGEHDREALERLAQLDGRRSRETSRILVAEVGGEVLAALPLDGGLPTADPFRPTAELVEMLKLRAAQLDPQDSTRLGVRDRLSRMLRGIRRPAIAPAVPGNERLLIPPD
jgi:hypothetical protein